MARIIASLAHDPTATPIGVVPHGVPMHLRAEPDQAGDYSYEWGLGAGATTDSRLDGPEVIAYFDQAPPGPHEITVTLYRTERNRRVAAEEGRLTLEVLRPAASRAPARHAVEGEVLEGAPARVEEFPTGELFDSGVLPVGLRRSPLPLTSDVALWMTIRRSTQALSFGAYREAMDLLLCGIQPGTEAGLARAGRAVSEIQTLKDRRYLPFNDTDAYRFLKVATEAYLLANVGVMVYNRQTNQYETVPFTQEEIRDASARLSTGRKAVTPTALDQYLVTLTTGDPRLGTIRTLPYLALVRQKLHDVGIKRSFFTNLDPRDTNSLDLSEECEGILAERLAAPLLLELIWSYWQEEGHLVQTMNAISRRFQNIRGPGDRDPLAELETDPLRPLNNLLWGYVQDEQHRLSILRRAYEYDHHYGMSLVGKAVGTLRPADSRSKFLEGFHNLLYFCTLFYQQDDDTTVIADGFPLLNALREVHLELSRGAHNQFGDLPSTARQEMLMQQWLLARSEFREFLPTRVMVAYPEPWMDRVDAMKGIQGWTDTSVLHFHNLAVYGEPLILSIRYGAWTDPNLQRDEAANWARFWRSEVQGYIHAYRAVTGVDLSAEVIDSRSANDRAVQPSILLRRQLQSQRRRTLPAPAESLQPTPRRRLPTG